MTRLRVLVVDDDAMLLNLVVRQLGASFDVLAEVDSSRALARILADERFDAVVSDRRMPTVDGPTLLREVRARSPRVARVLISGDIRPPEVRNDPDLVHACLTKPIAAEDLVEAVRSAVRSALHTGQFTDRVESSPG